MNKEKALSLAAAICSKKEHCSWEIQEKLVKWEIPEKEIDRIMTFLTMPVMPKPMPKISSGSTIGENRK